MAVLTASVLTVTWSELIRAGASLAAMTALLTVGLMVLPTASTRSTRLLGAVAVGQLVTAAAWLAEDEHFEGRVLWHFTTNHGLTIGDLLVIPPLLCAIALALAGHRHQPSYRRRSASYRRHSTFRP